MKTATSVMKCGCIKSHWAHAPPHCFTHQCDDTVEPPSLEGRKAQCYCHEEADSDYDLPFFSFGWVTDSYYCGHDGWA